MALSSNKPTVDRLRRALRHTQFATDQTLTADDDLLLAEQLEASIAWVELKTAMPFDGRAVHEDRDGNGTDSIMVFRGPITAVQLISVELPVLALTRTYTPTETKIYFKGRRIRVFTYKLAAEHATLHLDQQVYSQIFPSLPQCVHIDYTAGVPRLSADGAYTSLDGSQGAVDGVMRLAGDARDDKTLNWMRLAQQAAVCDAAAVMLGQIARNEVGIAGSVSFDGYSKGLNPQAYGPAVDALVERRDQLLGGIGGGQNAMWLTTGG